MNSGESVEVRESVILEYIAMAHRIYTWEFIHSLNGEDGELIGTLKRPH